jgi:hypothetical protein
MGVYLNAGRFQNSAGKNTAVDSFYFDRGIAMRTIYKFGHF